MIFVLNDRHVKVTEKRVMEGMRGTHSWSRSGIFV